MGVDFSRGHRAMDARQHRETYSDFTKLVGAAVTLVIVILAGMATFLT